MGSWCTVQFRKCKLNLFGPTKLSPKAANLFYIFPSTNIPPLTLTLHRVSY